MMWVSKCGHIDRWKSGTEIDWNNRECFSCHTQLTMTYSASTQRKAWKGQAK